MPPRSRLALSAGFLAIATVAATAITVLAPAGPALAGPALASNGPRGISAPEAAIANENTGAILWSRELTTVRPVASITKVMTALVVLRSHVSLNRVITVPKGVVGYVRKYGASNAGLRPGDRLTVNELLYAMLLPSGADAAYTLAQALGPGIPAFVAAMNATARQLRMTRSGFSNFDGLPYPHHNSDYSTAADLIKLGRAAMDWRAFRAVVGASAYHLAAGSGHHAYTWHNLNPLLGRYQGTTGIKTGWTPFAGHCLLFSVRLGGISLIGVNLDSPGQGSTVNGNDAGRMLNWAFAQPNR